MLTKDELLKIKKYLESIDDINYVVRQDLQDTWKEVYKLIYDALNNNQ